MNKQTPTIKRRICHTNGVLSYGFKNHAKISDTQNSFQGFITEREAGGNTTCYRFLRSAFSSRHRQQIHELQLTEFDKSLGAGISISAGGI